jgi:soluble lytic murein transglycosylase
MRKWLALGILLAVAGGVLSYAHWRTARFDALILKYSTMYALDFHLVKAIIWEESGFRPSARGKSGEFGLMQIMPYVGQEFWNKQNRAETYDAEMLLKPDHNIQVGCWYLRDSLDLYDHLSDPLPYALARYNAGQSRVARWLILQESSSQAEFLEVVDFPKTRDYVRRVISRAAKRSKIYFW